MNQQDASMSQAKLLFDTAVANFNSVATGKNEVGTLSVGLTQMAGAIRNARPNSKGEANLKAANELFFQAVTGKTDMVKGIAQGLEELAKALDKLLA
jgi:hypothetical protein